MQTYEFLSRRNVKSVILNLKRYGIAVIPNYTSRQTMSALNKDFDAVLEEKAGCVFALHSHPTNEQGRVARVATDHPDCEKRCPTLFKTFKDPFMGDVARSFYAPHKFNLNDNVFATHERSSEKQILPWHFDRQQSLKFWFYLKDTTFNDGALEYCPGSHFEGRYRANCFLLQGYSEGDLPNDVDPDLVHNPVAIEANAGDLIIFDPDGFHRGGVVRTGGERKVLRGHTHPVPTKSLMCASRLLRSPLNINRLFQGAGTRVVGQSVKDRSVNRKQNNEV